MSVTGVWLSRLNCCLMEWVFCKVFDGVIGSSCICHESGWDAVCDVFLDCNKSQTEVKQLLRQLIYATLNKAKRSVSTCPSQWTRNRLNHFSFMPFFTFMLTFSSWVHIAQKSLGGPSLQTLQWLTPSNTGESQFTQCGNVAQVYSTSTTWPMSLGIIPKQ